jgi:Tfp pilus assembly protein PilF
MARAWFQLGCVQAQSHSKEAAVSFKRAIHLKPDHAQAHYNLGQCLKEQGDPKAAAGQFRIALKCSPDYELARKALRDLEGADHSNKQ